MWQTCENPSTLEIVTAVRPHGPVRKAQHCRADHVFALSRRAPPREAGTGQTLLSPDILKGNNPRGVEVFNDGCVKVPLSNAWLAFIYFNYDK